MQLRFLEQPRTPDNQIGRALVAALSRPGVQSLTVVVAWAKRSGLRRLETSLRAFRAGGGTSVAIVGVDEGGASAEGLRMALRLFDVVWIFEDAGPRTFHPKLYLVKAPDAIVAIIGSGNSTKGGLWTNYEFAVELTLDPTDRNDSSLANQIDGYVTWLQTLTPALRRLDANEISRLLAAGKLQSEDGSRPRGAGGGTGPRTSVPGLAAAPAIPGAPGRDANDDDARPLEGIARRPRTTTPGLFPATGGSRVRDFWKVLSNYDTSLTSSPGQIVIPIEFLPFFPALTVNFDRRATGGARQSDVYFDLEYRDGAIVRTIRRARAILYEPAATHPRPNIELRFTFRNRPTLLTLNQGDTLTFRRRNGQIIVERTPGPPAGDPFGWL